MFVIFVKRCSGLLVVAFAALTASAPTHAAPCAGFSDVDSSNTLCADVEWIKNRGVTLGCAAGLYCPADSVTRLQMAAFLTRLGDAITPKFSFTYANYPATALTAPVQVCNTVALAAVNYPVSATIDGLATISAGSDIAVTVSIVSSNDFGTTWTPLPGTALAQSVAANGIGNVSDAASLDVDAGQTVWVGIGIAPLSGATALSSGQCRMKTMVVSRTGTSSPY